MDFINLFFANEYKKGFFFEYKGLKFLYIFDLRIPEKYIDNKDEIICLLKKNITITLDINKRIIFSLSDEINSTIIQIIEGDQISEIKFSSIYNFGNNKILPNNINYFILADFNIIKKIPCPHLEPNSKYFKYFLNPNNSIAILKPLLLIDEKYNIIGLPKKNNFTEGIFIWVCLEKLENYIENKKGKNYKYNIVNNTDKVYNNQLIKKLDDILKKEIFFDFIKSKKNPDYFVKASIFDKEKYISLRDEFKDKFENKKLSEIEKSCIGSIVGMGIGDAIGARVEFLPLSYNFNKIKDMGNFPAGKFNLKPGQWTDDTAMGLCIADSLIEKNGEFEPNDIMMRFILWWSCGYNNAFRFDDQRYNKHSVGLGGNISGSLHEYIKTRGKNVYTDYGDENTSGNGSIMRNAAIPICYFRQKGYALEYAKRQSLITHQGHEAAGCCQLMTFIILKILKLKELDEDNIQSSKNKKYTLAQILDNLQDFKCDYESVNYLAQSKKEGKERNWNWKDQNFKYSEYRSTKQPGYIGSYCMDGLAMGLHVLYTTDNFKDAILKAVNLCGDADSLGSIVGQIGGAFYGLDSIPEKWINTLNIWDHNEIALRGYILCNLNIK